MKTKLALIVSTVAILAIVGCARFSNKPIGNETEAQAVARADQARMDAGVFLKGAAKSASDIAIAKDPKNAQHVRLAVTIMDTFLVGTDYSPSALAKALQPVFKEVKDPSIELAINLLTTGYELAYGKHAKDQIAQNKIAMTFIMNLRQGAVDSLAGKE